jgi:hypothetical protein
MARLEFIENTRAWVQDCQNFVGNRIIFQMKRLQTRHMNRGPKSWPGGQHGAHWSGGVLVL